MKKSVLSVLLVCASWLVAPLALASERAQQGWEMIEQGAMVVDVRTPAEFESGHLSGAVNFPLSDLANYVDSLDKNTPLVLYCRSGRRSGVAYQYLQNLGFTQLHNAGGYEEMKRAK